MNNSSFLAAFLASLALIACSSKVDAEPQQTTATAAASSPGFFAPAPDNGRIEPINLADPANSPPPGLSGSPSTDPNGNSNARSPNGGINVRNASSNANVRNANADTNAQSPNSNSNAQSPGGSDPGVAPTSK